MPRTKEQFEDMRIKSKHIIIQTALELFTKEGYHATSINAIAKKAGVSVGLTYNYFSSKEDLLISIIDEYFEELFLEVSKVRGNQPISQSIVKIIDTIIETIVKRTSSWKLLISIMFQPDISKAAKNKFETLILHQESLFQVYFKEKGVDHPDQSAKVLTDVLHATFLHYALTGDAEGLKLIRETVIERLLKEGI